MAFDLDPSYKQVPDRIADFKAKHPEGCLRPANPDKPYWVEEVGGQSFLVVAAAAYRSPDDPTPGIGMAWEPVPGKTPYTRLSELQNAETSAWGRAIVAVLASESKAVSSAEDVRNRQADHATPPPPPPDPFAEAKRRVWETFIPTIPGDEQHTKEQLQDKLREAYAEWAGAPLMSATVEQLTEYALFLKGRVTT